MGIAVRAPSSALTRALLPAADGRGESVADTAESEALPDADTEAESEGETVETTTVASAMGPENVANADPVCEALLTPTTACVHCAVSPLIPHPMVCVCVTPPLATAKCAVRPDAFSTSVTAGGR